MREIKFRAWDGERMYPLSALILEGTSWNIEVGRAVCIPYQPSVTVMQYTCIKDKNGKEIYEGDVLRCTVEYPDAGESPYINSVVSWNPDGYFQCEFKGGDSMGLLELASFGYSGVVEDEEIIGNRYENPELLEAGND